jgi:hypothetical protein
MSGESRPSKLRSSPRRTGESWAVPSRPPDPKPVPGTCPRDGGPRRRAGVLLRLHGRRMSPRQVECFLDREPAAARITSLLTDFELEVQGDSIGHDLVMSGHATGFCCGFGPIWAGDNTVGHDLVVTDNTAPGRRLRLDQRLRESRWSRRDLLRELTHGQPKHAARTRLVRAIGWAERGRPQQQLPLGQETRLNLVGPASAGPHSLTRDWRGPAFGIVTRGALPSARKCAPAQSGRRASASASSSASARPFAYTLS